MCKYFSEKKTAFSLAEVLLTLVIIAIISAIALPGIRKNVSNAELQTALKKGYANLKQAWGLVILDNRNKPTLAVASNDTLVRGLRSRMAAKEVCTAATCFPKVIKGPLPPNFGTIGGTESTLMLDDGSLLAVLIDSSTCSAKKGTVQNVCAHAWLDINGFGAPNVYGVDVYGFWLTRDGVEPADIKYFKDNI